MKKSKYSDAQIMSILKQAENGVPVADLCREHGMSSASFYKWRSKYGGMDASLMARMKELDEENKRLKKMYEIMGSWGPEFSPSLVVSGLVDEAKNISIAMSNLQLDMEEFNLAPLLGDVIGLGKKGTQTFEIKPKGVNITVNFNVTMGAEDLATAIYKGNKKNKKEGFFVLTEEAKSAELEGTKGTA